MLDPRIYRTGLIAVLVAVIVVAFSLTNQQDGLSTTLPPVAFNGQNAYVDAVGLARKFPDVQPGTSGDDALAGKVATALKTDGFNVSTRRQSARTADGMRTLRTVIGTRAGVSGGASIVLVAHRDSSGRSTSVSLSGTAVLLELARVLSGQTQQRSIVLASTSGSAGAAGATQLARSLGTNVDAVIALGDLASSHVRQPVVVPWSNGQQVAPTALRKTLASALDAQARLSPSAPGFGSEFAHLAFPLSTGEQGPFGALGYPAVLLSLAGEGQPVSGTANPDRIAALGRTVLETVNSLDGGPSVAAPTAYLLFGGEVIPGWAVKLLVLALIVPVLMATVDGLARARRRGHSILRWLLWVLAGALPFLLATLLILGAQVTGLLAATPPGPLGAGAVPLGGSGIVMLALLGCVIVGLLLARLPLMAWLTGRRRIGSVANGGAGAAVLLVMCGLALFIWTRNPFAAALLIPALHTWMWVLDPDVRMPRAVAILLVVVGAAPGVLMVLYYVHSLGLDPVQAVWNGVLLVAGGYIGLVAAIQWSLVLGCLASVISVAARRPRVQRSRPEETPVTVRGPVTYAGPGSLGGTESALHR